MKMVYEARDITEAHIVAGLLKAEGIEAHVGGYYLQGGIGELAPMGFANVQVDDAVFDHARAVVADYEAATPSGQDRTRGDVLPRMAGTIVAILAALAVAGLLFILAV